MLTLAVIINIVCIINSAILAIVLLLNKPKILANQILAYIVFIPSLALLVNSLIEMKFYKAAIILFPVDMSLNFLWGAAFYYFVSIATKQWQGFKKSKLLHLLSLIIPLSFFIWLFSKPESFQNAYFDSVNSKTIPPFLFIVDNLMILQILIYFIFSYLKLKRYEKSITEIYSQIESVQLKWIKHFITMCVSLWLLLMFPFVFFPTLTFFMYFLPIGSAALYVYIVYKSLHSKTALNPISIELKEAFADVAKKKSEQNTNSDLEIEKRYEKIMAYLNEKKPYLETEINITKFSNLINESVHNVSVAINQKFNMSFFDLINSYRIDEAKAHLKNQKLSKLTVEAIAFEVGFNTPSSFYRAFKKHTNQTPSQFIKSI